MRLDPAIVLDHRDSDDASCILLGSPWLGSRGIKDTRTLFDVHEKQKVDGTGSPLHMHGYWRNFSVPGFKDTITHEQNPFSLLGKTLLIRQKGVCSGVISQSSDAGSGIRYKYVPEFLASRV